MRSRSFSNIVKVWVVRLVATLLAVAVIASWVLVGMDIDGKPAWLTLEAALGITAGVIGLVIVVLIITRLTKTSDGEPPRPWKTS